MLLCRRSLIILQEKGHKDVVIINQQYHNIKWDLKITSQRQLALLYPQQLLAWRPPTQRRLSYSNTSSHYLLNLNPLQLVELMLNRFPPKQHAHKTLPGSPLSWSHLSLLCSARQPHREPDHRGHIPTLFWIVTAGWLMVTFLLFV